jgi:hypothetical protein
MYGKRKAKLERGLKQREPFTSQKRDKMGGGKTQRKLCTLAYDNKAV